VDKQEHEDLFSIRETALASASIDAYVYKNKRIWKRTSMWSISRCTPKARSGLLVAEAWRERLWMRSVFFWRRSA
jgi:hypothetical protein